MSFFFVGWFQLVSSVCQVVCIGVRLSWAVQVALGSLLGCFGLLSVVSVSFNLFKSFSLSWVNLVLQIVFGCHGSLCFVVLRYLNCAMLF